MLLGILTVSSIDCKSPLDPGTEDITTYVTLLNIYGEPLDFYLDGVFIVTVEHESTFTVPNVTAGVHIFEAKITGTNTVVQSETVVVDIYLTYEWTVGNIPDINVINQYGEALRVFIDGTQVFTIEHEQNNWIQELALGEYFLEAKKQSDDQVVDTITIVIAEYKDYEWIIDGL